MADQRRKCGPVSRSIFQYDDTFARQSLFGSTAVIIRNGGDGRGFAEDVVARRHGLVNAFYLSYLSNTFPPALEWGA